MYSLFDFARLSSLLSFLFYGISCLSTDKMKMEFDRYGLSKFRILTGVLQVLGSLGLGIGFFYPPITVMAASGLFVLMLLGFAVRLKINDPWYMAVPALAYALLNLVIITRCFAAPL